jgi:hypothetical protein
LVCPPSPPVSPTSAHPLARPSWSLSPCFLLCLCPHTPHRPQLHGRSREQRYTRLADWQYIEQCAKAASPMPLFGGCPRSLLPIPMSPKATPTTAGGRCAVVSLLRPSLCPLRKRGHLVIRGCQPCHADWRLWDHDRPVNSPWPPGRLKPRLTAPAGTMQLVWWG